ncbi:MAG: hypothetical protein KC438_07290 [Thermomicrobiales bacterium]|nr:hypothetical protein [Thermomicrobiales bacterium]MCO5220151.1 hypothetical protein [Thermomicrobiales bacterium]
MRERTGDGQDIMRFDRRTFVTGAMSVPLVLEAQETRAADPPWMILAGQGSGPAGRWGHTLIADAGRNRLLLIGGRDEDGIARGDFWTFDLATLTWAEHNLTGPRSRFGSASAIASDGSGFYYYGGESRDSLLDDLWWFDFAETAWEPIEIEGDAPSARSETRGAIDGFGRFVISHGGNGDALFDDTWAYDPATRAWTDISPPADDRPLGRRDHDLVALPDYGLILLTGGCSDPMGPCPHGDLWAYDTTSAVWIDISPAYGPSPRMGAAMTRLGNTVLLVGGATDLGPSADVWVGSFDPGYFGWNELTQVNHGPLGIYRRTLHDMTASGNEFYVFGGRGVEGPLSDLWKFSLDRLGTRTEGGDYIEPVE